VSAARVDRLEALLQRIQANRHQPRAGGSPQGEDRARRPSKPTPLEMAVEGQLGRGAGASPPARREPAPPPAKAEPAPPAVRPQPAPPPSKPEPAPPSGPRDVQPAAVAPASAPVARTSGSAAVDPTSATFGELLRRTLSLQPR